MGRNALARLLHINHGQGRFRRRLLTWVARSVARLSVLVQVRSMNEDDQPDVNALIPELKDWNNGEGIDAEAWIGCMGNAELAIGYSLIFWPKFVRFKNYIIRAGLSNLDYIDGWEQRCKGDRGATESVVNHLHIVDIHSYGKNGTEAQIRYLGRTLKHIHEVKLRSEFPDLKFEVYFNDEPGLDIMDYQLTFWQID